MEKLEGRVENLIQSKPPKSELFFNPNPKWIKNIKNKITEKRKGKKKKKKEKKIVTFTNTCPELWPALSRNSSLVDD